MALRDKIAAKAAPQLEPGEQIQQVFAGQTASQWLALAGWIFFLLSNKYRAYVVTDQRIAVFDTGKWGMGNPKTLLGSLPRGTRLGPPSGLWHVVQLGDEKIRIHKRFHKDLAAADAAVGLT